MKRARRNPKKLCVDCRRKRAGYFNQFGQWKADKHHNLCPRCYRSHLDSALASLLVR